MVIGVARMPTVAQVCTANLSNVVMGIERTNVAGVLSVKVVSSVRDVVGFVHRRSVGKD